MEHYFRDASHEADGGDGSLQKWKPIMPAATGADSLNGCFDCNICLDFAHDPVVTLCGHLYCWPCIYKWLHLQSNSTSSDIQQQCPVCKADISYTTLVPLYGRGQNSGQPESEGKAPHLGLVIPRRPPACGVNALIAATSTSHPGQQLHGNDPYHHQQFFPNQFGSYAAASPAMFNLRGSTTTGMYHPIAGMFGEMVYARVFGNSQATLYAYPNSYHLTSNSNRRTRRHEMHADKSLNRVSIFLFCCFVLCLLLF